MTKMIERVSEAAWFDSNSSTAVGKAVIRAMREPTEKMIKAAMAVPAKDINSGYRKKVVAYWQAMIDSALEE